MSRFSTAYLFTLAALIPACVADEADAPPPPADDVATAAAWEDLGPARFSDDPGAITPEFETAGAPVVARDVAPVPSGQIALRMVDVKAKREYRVRMDREALRAISDAARAAGAERAELTEPAGERPDVVISEGWSNNHDSRQRFTNTTDWPYRAIGTLYDGGGDCTGTRIGPRIVLTAAHCIYSRTSGTYGNPNFTPGRNGAASAPYGSSGAEKLWVPDEYIAGQSPLNAYDIGVIVLDSAVGNGWMGYGAWSAGALDTHDIWMRGYPRCNTEGAPVGCQPKTLWGDTKRCELGTFFSPDADTWNREIKTNCDGSAGQSGSSFYFYTSENLPATFGVFSQHYCLGGCPESANNEWPNVITRITPTYLDVINMFRAQNP